MGLMLSQDNSHEVGLEKKVSNQRKKMSSFLDKATCTGKMGTW